MTVLDTFCGYCQGGSSPNAGLVLDNDGNFYGTTVGYDADNDGSVFKMNAKGTLTTLHRFRSDGDAPLAALLLASDGNFYGTTFNGGGSNNCAPYPGCGTIFKITKEGKLTTLHSFDQTDGTGPVGALIQGTDGSLYGTTTFGGANGYGTVFKIAMRGTFTTLHDFALADGAVPYGGLIQASDGNFYGTTSEGGDPNCYDGNCGTVFKITPTGILTTLHSFAGYPTEGAQPMAGLLQATDGNLYGTTYNGGANFLDGTIFKITPGGNLTTLYSFCSLAGCTDGARPYGGLVQATNGILYGVTYEGGSFDDGTVFSLDVGLGPFVTFVRFAGRVGRTGPILGQGFTGATSVSLNGIEADFTVVSDTHIKATVPPGATTGYVTVTTPSGTLTSNVPFHVIP
jgi:uncharacterized repeat protein (TIGR03803 family)